MQFERHRLTWYLKFRLFIGWTSTRCQDQSRQPTLQTIIKPCLTDCSNGCVIKFYLINSNKKDSNKCRETRNKKVIHSQVSTSTMHSSRVAKSLLHNYRFSHSSFEYCWSNNSEKSGNKLMWGLTSESWTEKLWKSNKKNKLLENMKMKMRKKTNFCSEITCISSAVSLTLQNLYFFSSQLKLRNFIIFFKHSWILLQEKSRSSECKEEGIHFEENSLEFCNSIQNSQQKCIPYEQKKCTFHNYLFARFSAWKTRWVNKYGFCLKH